MDDCMSINYMVFITNLRIFVCERFPRGGPLYPLFVVKGDYNCGGHWNETAKAEASYDSRSGVSTIYA